MPNFPYVTATTDSLLLLSDVPPASDGQSCFTNSATDYAAPTNRWRHCSNTENYGPSAVAAQSTVPTDGASVQVK